MKLLLDTHVFMWWDDDDRRLSKTAFDAISDPGNEVWFSVVNIWEMVAKNQIGKLTLQRPIRISIQIQLSNRLRLLNVELPHVLTIDALPLIHRDPFDRLLVAQAIAEGASLVTADAILSSYPATILW